MFFLLNLFIRCCPQMYSKRVRSLVKPHLAVFFPACRVLMEPNNPHYYYYFCCGMAFRKRLRFIPIFLFWSRVAHVSSALCGCWFLRKLGASLGGIRVTLLLRKRLHNTMRVLHTPLGETASRHWRRQGEGGGGGFQRKACHRKRFYNTHASHNLFCSLLLKSLSRKNVACEQRCLKRVL